ncbi:hypothetical protein R5R35_011258 [Gryllus longicercus]|uniref:Odorant binding protein n=1 Tax=Gryllus longicercus TaxID=2509291 RepID=A0AAN9VSX4_9ORTH
MRTFSVLVVVALSVVVGLPGDVKKVEPHKKERRSNACLKALMERQNIEESWTDEERKNSTASKCFIACIMEKKGLVRRGSVDEKRVLEYVRAAAKNVNAVMQRQQMDTEHWGQETLKCIRHESSIDDCELGNNVWHCLLFNMRESTYRVPDSEVVQTEV